MQEEVVALFQFATGDVRHAHHFGVVVLEHLDHLGTGNRAHHVIGSVHRLERLFGQPLLNISGQQVHAFFKFGAGALAGDRRCRAALLLQATEHASFFVRTRHIQCAEELILIHRAQQVVFAAFNLSQGYHVVSSVDLIV